METKNEIHMYVLTQEQINQIAAIAGKEAVQTFRTEQAKVEKRRAREENKVKKRKRCLVPIEESRPHCQTRQDLQKKNRLNLDGNLYKTLWGMQERQ